MKIADAAKKLRDAKATGDADIIAKTIFEMDTDVYIRASEYNRKNK